MITRKKAGIAALAIGGAMTMGTLVMTGNAGAGATNPVYVDGNATTCAHVGYPNATFYGGSNSNGSTDVGPFTATVAGNTYVTLSDFSPGLSIFVVVVKGGSNYYKYSPPLANMHAPDVGAGNTPQLSHWYVCYSYTPPVDTEPEVTEPEVTTPDTEPETTEPETTQPGDTTTTQVGQEGPTTTAVSSGGGTGGELPATGQGSVLVLTLGIGLMLGGGCLAFYTRRPAKS